MVELVKSAVLGLLARMPDYSKCDCIYKLIKFMLDFMLCVFKREKNMICPCIFISLFDYTSYPLQM